MSTTAVENVTVDTTEADRELQELQRSAQITSQSVIRTARRSFATLNIVLDAFDIAIGAALEALIQSAFLFAESLAEFAAAETVLGSPRGILLFTMSAVLFYRAVMLQGQRNQITDIIDAGNRIGNIWL